jgi:hypothetical protein
VPVSARMMPRRDAFWTSDFVRLPKHHPSKSPTGSPSDKLPEAFPSMFASAMSDTIAELAVQYSGQVELGIFLFQGCLRQQ